MTLFECWRNLFWAGKGRPVIDLLALQRVLEKMPGVETGRGFYFLKGDLGLVKKRLDFHNFSQPKWKRARRVTRLLALLPFVRMIGVCNTVAFNTANRESDIDLLIIVRTGRMWTARFLVTSLVSFLGLRRHKDKIADRLCLSFYLADSHLDLQKVALKDKGEIRDPYLAHWLSQVSPIYDDGVALEFFRQNKKLLSSLPFYVRYSGVPRRIVKPLILGEIAKRLQEMLLGHRLGDLIEAALKKIQISKMSRNTKSAAQEDNTKVIISDEILKFHEKDLREYYHDTLAKRFGLV